MFERELYYKLAHSNVFSFVYKIPDPSRFDRYAVKRPFDLIVVYNNEVMFVECKVIKNTYRFNSNRLLPHQVYYLSLIKKLATNCKCVVCICVDFKYKKKECFFIDIEDVSKHKSIDLLKFDHILFKVTL